MPEIRYLDKILYARDGELVLDCLLRHGTDVSFSCRNGVCRTCLLRNTTGVVQGRGRQLLPQEQIDAGYFLPCKTLALEGMEIVAANPCDGTQTSSIRPAKIGGDRGKLPPGWQEAPYPPAQPALWCALLEGDRLKNILDDFYELVFADPLLSPYFHNTTRQRSKEKVYSFYKRIFSGEECYFGDRPKNAHHWMVISDDIFDHRLALLVGCMARHGLDDSHITTWLSYEEHYRRDIVKTEPQGRRIGDTVLPAGGFDYDVLAEGSMCDSCNEAIDRDTRVLYNLRTGHIYCPDCHGSERTQFGAG
jgi:truncated hemoglobin YjbI/ferredoxin